MKKVILKRAKLEQWVENTYLKEIVMGAYVRYSVAGKYRLAEIVDVINKPDSIYDLGKYKTGY